MLKSNWSNKRDMKKLKAWLLPNHQAIVMSSSECELN